MKQANNRVDIKIVLVGDQMVGKTTLLHRFVHDTFRDTSFPTIGAAFAAKEVASNGKKKVIGVWDTAGTERYRAMSKLFYRDARAAIVCYDVTSSSSWDELRSWITELREVEQSCKIYICGTKKDLIEDGTNEREVSEEKSCEYPRGIQVQIFETSSKTGENVGELFQKIIDDCLASDYDLEKNGKVLLTKESGNRSCCNLS